MADDYESYSLPQLLDLIKNLGQPATLQTAEANWEGLAGELVRRIGFSRGDSATLNGLIAAVAPHWKGSGADAYGQHVNDLSNYGIDVAARAYLTSYGAPSSNFATFHSATDDAHTALTYVKQQAAQIVPLTDDNAKSGYLNSLSPQDRASVEIPSRFPNPAREQAIQHAVTTYQTSYNEALRQQALQLLNYLSAAYTSIADNLPTKAPGNPPTPTDTSTAVSPNGVGLGSAPGLTTALAGSGADGPDHGRPDVTRAGPGRSSQRRPAARCPPTERVASCRTQRCSIRRRPLVPVSRSGSASPGSLGFPQRADGHPVVGSGSDDAAGQFHAADHRFGTWFRALRRRPCAVRLAAGEHRARVGEPAGAVRPLRCGSGRHWPGRCAAGRCTARRAASGRHTGRHPSGWSGGSRLALWAGRGTGRGRSARRRPGCRCRQRRRHCGTRGCHRRGSRRTRRRRRRRWRHADDAVPADEPHGRSRDRCGRPAPLARRGRGRLGGRHGPTGAAGHWPDRLTTTDTGWAARKRPAAHPVATSEEHTRCPSSTTGCARSSTTC